MVASTLLALFLKSLVILGLAGAVALLLHRQSAAKRHVVWTVGVACLLALPVASAVLPGTPLPRSVDRVIPWIASPTVLPQSAVSPAGTPVSDGETGRDGTAFSGAETPAELVRSSIKSASWLVGVWAVGVVLLLARLAVGFVYVRHIERKSFDMDEAAWLRLSDDLCRELGLDRRPRLLWNTHIASPMTWGLRRPTVVLPASASSWAEKQRRIVLAHELAHVRRRDVLVVVLGRMACALYWPNPIAWLAAHQLSLEGEYACDDLVLSLGTRRQSYAEGLLAVARMVGAERAEKLPALPMARGSELEQRLCAVLSPIRARSPFGRVARRVVWGAALCIFIPLAAFRPTSVHHGELSTSGESVWASQGVPLAICEQDRWTTLGDEDPIATKHNLRLLQSDDPDDRKEAVNRLGNVATSEAVPALIGALDDPSEHVRQGAAAALGNRGDDRAVVPLIAALGDPSEHVRQNAVGALGDLGDSRAVDPLVSMLVSPEKHIRQAAATALGRLGRRRAVTALTTSLGDPEPHVVGAAAQALGQLGAQEVSAKIVRLFETSRHRHVQIAAARSLGQLGDKRGTGVLITTLRDAPEQFTRGDAAWALGAVGRIHGAEAALLNALDDESRFVRYAAVCSLGRTGSEESEVSLRRSLSDTSPQVRAGSEWALDKIASR